MMKSPFVILVAFSFVTACTSGTKKAPPSAALIQEIQGMESDIKTGYASHFDVLAAGEFNKALKHFKQAKQNLKDDESPEEVLAEIGRARVHFLAAVGKAEEKNQHAVGLTTARSKAVAAGARGFSVTKADLKRLDDQFRDNIDELEKMDSAAYAELQKGYLKVELAAIEETQLGDAKARIAAAHKAGAGKVTPKALRQAEMDLKNAQNQINANRNTPELFGPAVGKATDSTKLLGSIFSTATRDGNRLDEKTATQIVLQNMRIGSLEGRLTEKESEAQRKAQELQQRQQDLQMQLQKQRRELSHASAAVAMQNSIEQARQSFSEEEADVFQQGGKLIIRLKTMNFPSGRAELPAEALAILAKVKSVATQLTPGSVTIEGHTDSMGDPDMNEKLSQKRAEAVAKYLSTTGIEPQKIQAIGYGFKRPISSNRSPVGRSQNRRVDVVITPSNQVAAVQLEE